jgi:glutathione peroxidase
MNAKDFTVRKADGTSMKLSEIDGPILAVNVASKCGLTPQYEGLEALNREYGPKGLTILGFPCNQFMGQEPGTADEIASFCSLTYDVTFPILAKIEVNGSGADPFSSRSRAVCSAHRSSGTSPNSSSTRTARSSSGLRRLTSPRA